MLNINSFPSILVYSNIKNKYNFLKFWTSISSFPNKFHKKLKIIVFTAINL